MDRRKTLAPRHQVLFSGLSDPVLFFSPPLHATRTISIAPDINLCVDQFWQMPASLVLVGRSAVVADVALRRSSHAAA